VTQFHVSVRRFLDRLSNSLCLFKIVGNQSKQLSEKVAEKRKRVNDSVNERR
jgi:hypothetical protein